MDTDLLFSSDAEGNNLLVPDSVSHAWRRFVRKAGIRIIRLHDTCHTHTSLILKQGIHPKIVQSRPGHATISTTIDIYFRIAPGLQERAALRFDEVFYHWV